MDALDVISLDAAKNHLVVLNDNFYDAQITGLIETAIAMVEQYTDYRLYERDVVINMLGCKQDITLYPIVINGVTQGSTAQVYKTFPRALSVIVDCYDWYGSVISATVGYDDPADIPRPLIAAAYKLLTYLFENKDAYSVTIPYDVQLLLNQFRRSLTI